MTQTCRHPLSSVRWDAHHARLRCRACGRLLDQCPCPCHDTVSDMAAGFIPCPACAALDPVGVQEELPL